MPRCLQCTPGSVEIDWLTTLSPSSCIVVQHTRGWPPSTRARHQERLKNVQAEKAGNVMQKILIKGPPSINLHNALSECLPTHQQPGPSKSIGDRNGNVTLQNAVRSEKLQAFVQCRLGRRTVLYCGTEYSKSNCMGMCPASCAICPTNDCWRLGWVQEPEFSETVQNSVSREEGAAASNVSGESLAAKW